MKNKFKDILIVSDIDGTLLGSDNHIPKRNLEMIEYFITNGGNFTIATARDTQSSKRFYKELSIKIPCILCNGAMIYDFENDNFINCEYLHESSIKCIEDIKINFPDVGIKIK
ncbi:MAG: HAD-IIB family hydrolase [Clostridia bacterium]